MVDCWFSLSCKSCIFARLRPHVGLRFLRTENSYLKGHDFLREIEALPPLPKRTPRPPTPPLVASGNSDTDMSNSDEPLPPPTLFSLSTETYRDVMKYPSAPRELPAVLGIIKQSATSTVVKDMRPGTSDDTNRRGQTRVADGFSTQVVRNICSRISNLFRPCNRQGELAHKIVK
jgi:hypothetical protein